MTLEPLTRPRAVLSPAEVLVGLGLPLAIAVVGAVLSLLNVSAGPTLIVITQFLAVSVITIELLRKALNDSGWYVFWIPVVWVYAVVVTFLVLAAASLLTGNAVITT